MLYLHIYLKLRKNIGFTNIFQWIDKCLLVKCQGRKSGQSGSSTSRRRKDADSILQGGLLVKCVYRMYYLNYFNSNTLYNMDTQPKDILQMYNKGLPQHRELCSASCGSLGGRGLWGRADTCVCTAGSLHCSRKLPQQRVLIAISQYKIKT